MTAVVAFFKKYICCCLGGGGDQPNTVLSHNRVNCSSCFGRIDDEEEEDNVNGSTQTVNEGRVLRSSTGGPAQSTQTNM